MPDLQIPHIEASLGEAKYIGAAKPEQEIEDTITQNGTHVYEPDPGKALSKVTAIVNVPEQKPEQEKSATATDNGSVVLEPDTGKVLSKATVVVNVPKEKPEETMSVRYTQNGTNIITPSPGKVMKEIDVQVAVPDIPPVIRYLSVNKNGVYTAPSGIDGYSPISVNCPVAKQEEEKSVKYTANGTNTVTPTPGKVMKSVSVEVAVPSDKKPEEQGAYTFTENGDFTIQPTAGSVFRSFLAHVNVSGGGGTPGITVSEVVCDRSCNSTADIAEFIGTLNPHGVFIMYDPQILLPADQVTLENASFLICLLVADFPPYNGNLNANAAFIGRLDTGTIRMVTYNSTGWTCRIQNGHILKVIEVDVT